MAIESGREDIVVGLLDGPVALSHPDLADARVRIIPGAGSRAPDGDGGVAYRHGTFVAGILSARRSSAAPGICPGCTLVVRPIFEDRADLAAPSATAAELARAVLESLDAGARVINVSGALSPTIGREPELEAALDFVARRGAVVIAAAGNHGTVASSSLTRHPAVIAVTQCDAEGRPMPASNLARSLGSRGIAAPGVVTSITPDGSLATLSGTSFAAAIVSGACALLWSAFPRAGRHEIAWGITGPRRRTSVAPPCLDAWMTYRRLSGRVGAAG